MNLQPEQIVKTEELEALEHIGYFGLSRVYTDGEKKYLVDMIDDFRWRIVLVYSK